MKGSRSGSWTGRTLECEVCPLDLYGAYLIELDRHDDNQGFFARAWCRDEFAEHGLDEAHPVQPLARDIRAGTLRGMHFQRSPHAEIKVVRCTRGAILTPSSTCVDVPFTWAWFGVALDGRVGQRLHTAWLRARLPDPRR